MPVTIPSCDQHALRNTSAYANCLLLSFAYEIYNFDSVVSYTHFLMCKWIYKMWGK